MAKEATATIYGLEKLDKKLKRIKRDVRPELEAATDEALGYVHSTVPGYPPPPPLSTYRRTGTLGRSITTEVKSIGRQVVGAIGTNLVYSPWVISKEELLDGRGPQAEVHEGRWWTLQGVVERAKDEVINIYRAAVRRMVRKR